MGMYVAARGWIELRHELRPDLEAVIRRHHQERDSGGWAFPTKPFSWRLYVFYGGDIRESAVGWLEQQVREIATLGAVQDAEDYPRGMFVLNDERKQSWLWTVKDGVMTTRLDPSYVWLDD
jgi:hypothetical protein